MTPVEPTRQLATGAEPHSLNAGLEELWLRDPRAALELLEADLARYLETADVLGLKHVESSAVAAEEGSSGRNRRRAERIAEQARARIEEIKESEREEKRATEAAKALEATLRVQFDTALALLLTDDDETASALAPLRALSTPDADGRLRFDSERAFDAWLPLIVTSYDHGRRTFADVGFEPSSEDRRAIERALKSIAVELMAAGASVRGLTTDAIPLIAYALFNNRLPVAPEALASVTLERVDDLILSMADGVAELPPKDRRLFVALFRIAILLGHAQTYADQLSLKFVSLFVPQAR